MKKIILITMLAISFVACKKKECNPQIIEKPVDHYIHDTVHQTNTDTVTVHDTTYISVTPLPLIGQWYLWKWENFTGNTLVSTQYPSTWTFTFTPTDLIQDLGSSGTYTYPINYYNGYVDVFLTSTPTSYFITPTNNGTEYIMTKSPGSGNYQVYYLRK